MREWLTKNVPNEARRTTSLWSQYLSFNSRRKPFDDVRVRKALAMAIDRKAILNDIFAGAYGDEAQSVLPPGVANVDLSARVEWAGQSMEQRRAKAIELLAAAGYGPGNPLKFTYNFSTNTDNRRTAVATQAMWKQIGVIAEIVTTEGKVHQKLLQAHDFDVAQDGWILDYNDARISSICSRARPSK
jgi:oligopeptide transport system substrate-binding protein